MTIEVSYRPNADMVLKIEARDIKDVFQQLGPLQEVFNCCKCGKCGSEKIRLVHRKPDKFDFYELLCTACGAKLSLGQNDSGNLFPRRYEQDPDDPKKPLMKDGKKIWLENGGWVKYTVAAKKGEG